MASAIPNEPPSPAAPAPSLDPETSPIPGQQAWAILDLHGRLVRSSVGDATNADNKLPPVIRDASTLYGMLVEATPLASAGLRRMTVSFAALRYVIARDDHHIYLVQTKG